MSRQSHALLAGKDVATRRPRDDAPPGLVFERLLPRYERRFGALPPVDGADVETANRLMRRALAEAGALNGGRPGARGTH